MSSIAYPSYRVQGCIGVECLRRVQRGLVDARTSVRSTTNRCRYSRLVVLLQPWDEHLTRRSASWQRTVELFGQRSYARIGIPEVCAAAGLPKGSFCYFVPSKQALALAVVDEHWVWQRDLGVNILTDPAPIVERLCRLFVLIAEMQRSPGA